jgi:integrase/recombinase XerD
MELDYRATLRYADAKKQSHRRRERKLPRWPKDDDVDRLLEGVRLMECDSPPKERNTAILEFLASTGCRNNEIVQLKVRDVDLKKMTTIVNGKGSKERRVFFNKNTADAIRSYWTSRKSSNLNDPLFARHDKKAGYHTALKPMSTDTPRNVVKAVVSFVGIEKGKFSPHYFRHAFAIRVLSETGNLALTQDLLGHDDPASTRVYAKIRSEDLQKAHSKIFNS